MDPLSTTALALDPHSVPCRAWSLSCDNSTVPSHGRSDSEVETKNTGTTWRIGNSPDAIAAIVAGPTAAAEHANPSRIIGHALAALTGQAESAFVRGRGSPVTRNRTSARPSDGYNCFGSIDGIFLLNSEHAVVVDVSDQSGH
jgi:hypothetical protein